MSGWYCTDCKKETELMVDPSTGDRLCSECGFVLESRSIDETSECRTFANESSSNSGRSRVGGPTNPLLATMSDRLGLAATIKDRANEIFKRLEDQNSSRGRNQDALLAACLFISCRQENKPRTIKEICSVANGATKKEIGRRKNYIAKTLGLETGQSVEMGAIHASDYM